MNGKMIKGLEAGWGTRGKEAEACKNLEEGGLTGAGGIEVGPQVGSPRAWLASGGALADSHHCPCSTPIAPPRSPCSHRLSPHALGQVGFPGGLEVREPGGDQSTWEAWWLALISVSLPTHSDEQGHPNVSRLHLSPRALWGSSLAWRVPKALGN